MRLVFNAPPGWPVPQPGWLPTPGWRPDPAWPEAPPGWIFYLPEAHTAVELVLRARGALMLVLGAVALGLALAFTAGASLWWGWDAVGAGIAGFLGLLSIVYVVMGSLLVADARRRAERLLVRRPCVLVPITSSSGRPAA